MKVTFCGHRSVKNINVVKKWLFKVTEELILDGAKVFYLGGYGKFDYLCKEVLIKQKEMHPNIELVLVLPYINHNLTNEGYDYTLYPEIEKTSYKFAIIKRNQWMVENSDFFGCVCL